MSKSKDPKEKMPEDEYLDIENFMKSKMKDKDHDKIPKIIGNKGDIREKTVERLMKYLKKLEKKT